MELHEKVARCFTDAFEEWSREETDRILKMDEFDRIFANLHKQIQDKAVMDILKRADRKVQALNESGS